MLIAWAQTWSSRRTLTLGLTTHLHNQYPYIDSPGDNDGLLELWIKSTSKVVSILVGWASTRMSRPRSKHDQRHSRNRNQRTCDIPCGRAHAVNEPEPSDSRRHVDSTVGSIDTPRGGWVKREEPDEEGERGSSRDKHPDRCAILPPEIRQIAPDSLGEGRCDEERGGGSYVH